jgi:hypothetical protein
MQKEALQVQNEEKADTVEVYDYATAAIPIENSQSSGYKDLLRNMTSFTPKMLLTGKSIPTDLIDLINSMCSFLPETRPTAHEVGVAFKKLSGGNNNQVEFAVIVYFALS